MRLAIYSDYGYRYDGEQLWAELSVVLFLGDLARWFEGVTLVGRLDPQPGSWAYRVPSEVGFAALPHYRTLARPAAALRALVASMRCFWRVLDDVDAVWLLGPHPFALPFVALAWIRRRRVFLGVRQDFPSYVANRHPRRPLLRVAALALEASWRLLARACPVVVVGSDLAHRYRSAKRVLPIAISLVREAELAEQSSIARRDYRGELRVLSVGRLAAEKNPLLLADVLAELVARDPRWRLTVCGDGPLAGELRERLARLGVAERAELLGFVSLDEQLPELYRSSHLLLHCSWTEGMPQVLIEAFAARLPIVATAVGGVAQAAEGAALLIPPGDAGAAAEALRRLAEDERLRAELTEAGATRAREQSLEAQTRKVAQFFGAVADATRPFPARRSDVAARG